MLTFVPELSLPGYSGADLGPHLQYVFCSHFFLKVRLLPQEAGCVCWPPDV